MSIQRESPCHVGRNGENKESITVWSWTERKSKSHVLLLTRLPLIASAVDPKEGKSIFSFNMDRASANRSKEDKHQRVITDSEAYPRTSTSQSLLQPIH
ncbi:unnamed protein product [Gadus morhua 'NCC']